MRHMHVSKHCQAYFLSIGSHDQYKLLSPVPLLSMADISESMITRCQLLHSFHCCFAALEAAACGLVEVCLANPQHFYVTEVLGPACIAIAEAEPPVRALTRECACTRKLFK